MKKTIITIALLLTSFQSFAAAAVLRNINLNSDPDALKYKIENSQKAFELYKLDPNHQYPQMCYKPAFYALAYWGASQQIDLPAIKSELTQAEYKMLDYLTYDQFVNETAGLHEVLKWKFNYYYLLSSCEDRLAKEAERKAIESKIYTREPPQ